MLKTSAKLGLGRLWYDMGDASVENPQYLGPYPTEIIAYQIALWRNSFASSKKMIERQHSKSVRKCTDGIIRMVSFNTSCQCVIPACKPCGGCFSSITNFGKKKTFSWMTWKAQLRQASILKYVTLWQWGDAGKSGMETLIITLHARNARYRARRDSKSVLLWDLARQVSDTLPMYLCWKAFSTFTLFATCLELNNFQQIKDCLWDPSTMRCDKLFADFRFLLISGAATCLDSNGRGSAN